MILKQIIIDNETSVDYLANIFEKDYSVQLRFFSKQDFYDNFYRFSCILFDYAHKIKSVYMPITGNIFEDTVYLLSELEDQLEIEIGHIVIHGSFKEDIKQLCDFYEEDIKDGSLNICILDMFDYYNSIPLSNFVDIIAFIEHRNINGLTMGIQGDMFFARGMPICIWRSVRKYISAYFTHTECKDKDYKGYIIE